MRDTCVSILIINNTTVNQLETNVLLTISITWATCYLQTCNIVASEEMVADTCVLSLIVINTTINQLESIKYH